jgi:hypothetical protein
MPEFLRTQPRYPLDDSWLFADPMTIALQEGHGAEVVADERAALNETAAAQSAMTLDIAPGALSRPAASCVRDPAMPCCAAQRASIAPLLRRRWLVICCGIMLASGIAYSHWPSATEFQLQVAADGLAIVRMHCGAATENTTLSRTL